MTSHIPVLLNEVLEHLDIEDNKLYLDCTFGAGGYSKAIISQANCKVIAIDQDPTTKKYADNLKEKYGERFEYINTNFRNIGQIFGNEIKFDGIVYDFGVSSMQLDEGERGFSFQENAKLDMRMSISGKSAYDVVNKYEEQELARIIYYFGEERASRKIAKKIVEVRQENPIETTFALAEIIRSVVPKKGKIDPATKTFQAIRIEVNDEISAISDSISQIDKILKIGGRAIFVSFHSLEDSLIKSFIKESSNPKIAISKYKKEKQVYTKPFKIISNKAVMPNRDEILRNPRSRSAKMRVIERVA